MTHRHRRAAASTSRLAFPSEKTGGVIFGWTKLVADLKEASGVDFTLHDLRRTSRTLMSCLGVKRSIAELAIGHKREELEALYNFDQALRQGLRPHGRASRPRGCGGQCGS